MRNKEVKKEISARRQWLKLNLYSFKFNIWLYFVFFVVIMISLTLTLQVIALRPLDSTIKLILTKALCAPIVNVCTESDYSAIPEKLSSLEIEDDLQYAVFTLQSSSPIAKTGDFYLSLYPEYQVAIAGMGVNAELSKLYDGDSVFYAVYAKKVVNVSIETELIIFASLPAGEYTSAKAMITWVSIVISIINLFIAIIFAAFISRRFSRPLTAIEYKARSLAKGDYDISFEKSSFTELDSLSNTLVLTAQRLSEADSLKNELLANISHDLKTPLTLIKSYAEMVKEVSGGDPVKRDKHLDVIISEADRLAMLVNDLVCLSKLQASKEEMQFSDFNLSTEVSRMVDNFRCLEGYVFHTEIIPDIKVFADREKVLQVISNILNNAVNYTGKDKSVKVKVFIADSNRARVEITDSGKGIPEDELNKIWDRYYRSSRTHYREVTGSGLGLSIVKSILDSHHTEYGVISEINKGSTFFFYLCTSKNVK